MNSCQLAPGLKVAVFDVQGVYFSVPSLHCIYDELRLAGAAVDVYIDRGRDTLGQFTDGRRFAFPVYPEAWSGSLRATLRNWRACLRRRRQPNPLRSERYDFVLAVNPDGIVPAYHYWRRTGTPYIYLSFELFFRQELETAPLRAWKAVERRASRHAAFITIQDKWRARMLAEENGVSPDQMLFLPVAPRGGGVSARSGYLRKKLNIPDEQVIVLQPGSFRAFTQAEELLAALPAWPRDIAFVVNCYYKPGGKDPYLDRLRELGLPNVYLMPHALGRAEYEEMLCSADVGLALYKPALQSIYQGRNIQVMGHSSGKVAYFAKHGIPVICGGSDTFKECLEGYKFGEWAETAAAVPALARRIKSDWSAYSAESRRFFAEQLDFNLYWPPVARRINSLTEGTRRNTSEQCLARDGR